VIYTEGALRNALGAFPDRHVDRQHTEAASSTTETTSAAEAPASTARIGLGGQPAFFSLILCRSRLASTFSSSAATSSHFLAISSSLAAK
jgi:hypothetical protein